MSRLDVADVVGGHAVEGVGVAAGPVNTAEVCVVSSARRVRAAVVGDVDAVSWQCPIRRYRPGRTN